MKIRPSSIHWGQFEWGFKLWTTAALFKNADCDRAMGLWGNVSVSTFCLSSWKCCSCNNKKQGRKRNEKVIKKEKVRTLCWYKCLCRCKAKVTCFSAFFTSLSSSCSAWVVRSSWINSSRFSFPSNICIKSNQRETCKLASLAPRTRTHTQWLANSGFSSAFGDDRAGVFHRASSVLFSTPAAAQAGKELS